jgi:flagellum-specific peptidoglycan hydrolase FlgJ
MGNNESNAVVWIAATVITLYMALTSLMEHRYEASKQQGKQEYLEAAREKDRKMRARRDSFYAAAKPKALKASNSSGGKKVVAIYAGANETYPDVGYDEDYWSLRGYMSAYEMQGKHCPNNEASTRLYKKKLRVQKEFVEMVSKKAIEVCANTKVPPSILVAQAILESGYGTSRLSHLAKNLFGHMSFSNKPQEGISGKIAAQDRNVAGAVQTYYFRVYETVWWSMKHHVKILENGYAHRRPNIKGLKERDRWLAALCGCSNSKMHYKDSYRMAVTKGGYLYAGACAWRASDGKTSRYVAELKWVIESYGLDKLDDYWVKSI